MSRGSKEELELKESISKWYKDSIRAFVIISATYLALFIIIFSVFYSALLVICPWMCNMQ